MQSKNNIYVVTSNAIQGMDRRSMGAKQTYAWNPGYSKWLSEGSVPCMLLEFLLERVSLMSNSQHEKYAIEQGASQKCLSQGVRVK